MPCLSIECLIGLTIGSISVLVWLFIFHSISIYLFVLMKALFLIWTSLHCLFICMFACFHLASIVLLADYHLFLLFDVFLPPHIPWIWQGGGIVLVHFFNGPTSASFSFIFGLFKQYNFYNKSMWIKCPSNIRRRDSNPLPLETEPSPITTRPGRIINLLPTAALLLKLYIIPNLTLNRNLIPR